MPTEPINELDVAKAVAAGRLPSPTAFGNSWYFRIKISGTGASYRSRHEEFVFRSSAIWCSPEMVERCCGLPVISEHPSEGTLTGPEFYRRIVGIVVRGFVENNELWGVCRIIDDHAAKVLTSGFFDTSPSVTFADPDQNVMLEIGDEEKLLIEGTPSFLDHVALVDTSTGGAGVWGAAKEGADLGVEISEPEKETTNA